MRLAIILIMTMMVVMMTMILVMMPMIFADDEDDNKVSTCMKLSFKQSPSLIKTWQVVKKIQLSFSKMICLHIF